MSEQINPPGILDRISNEWPLPSEVGRIWFENTNTKSSPEHGGPGWEFGKCLWSPAKAKDGSDRYKAMREIQAGDLVLHSCDGELCGISFAKDAYRERKDDPPDPGPWAGAAPFYRVDLERFAPLEKPIALKNLYEQHGERLRREIESIRSDAENYLRPPFALVDSDKVKLGQTYLTNCTHGLYQILRDWVWLDAHHAETPTSLGAPFDEIFATFEEARWGFGLIKKVLLKLGVEASGAESDQRICLSLSRRSGEGVRLRLNFGNWAILTFLNRSVGEDRVQYICRAELVPGASPIAVPSDRFADEIDGQVFVLPTGAMATLRNPESVERKAFEESLTQVARRFKEWKGGPYQATHQPEVLQMVYDLQLREKFLREGLGLSEERVEFTKSDALKDLFMTEVQLDVILARLKRKKAIILQGPPGVGKTFIARRLAFALMGERDDRRVTMVQFHPSYGYEDFVQGYRPAMTGLERRDGVFHKFARLARDDPERDWFFIIDEINRGNLAKVFGELLMLLEADKRGPEHAIPLTYSEKDETFDFPANLHVIGTMNTADRSLAMVDYALRRRFAFVTLDPAFDSPAFATWLTERGASAALLARIRNRVTGVNEVIEKERDLGAGFRIGHSFFCPAKDQVPDEAWYREVIESEIQPLLEEYFDSRDLVKNLVSDLLA